jgi:hypothetical protein
MPRPARKQLTGFEVSAVCEAVLAAEAVAMVLVVACAS